MAIKKREAGCPEENGIALRLSAARRSWAGSLHVQKEVALRLPEARQEIKLDLTRTYGGTIDGRS